MAAWTASACRVSRTSWTRTAATPARAPAGITAHIQYLSDLFDHSTVVSIADRLTRLLEAVTTDPDQPVGQPVRCVPALHGPGHGHQGGGDVPLGQRGQDRWGEVGFLLQAANRHGLVEGGEGIAGRPVPPSDDALERVPVETEPLGALLRAGFGGLFYEKLGDIHCFRVNGVELRELRLHGWKPGAAAGRVAVVYKGPCEQVADECGTVYRRGEKVVVCAMVAGWLRTGPAADQFAFLAPS